MGVILYQVEQVTCLQASESTSKKPNTLVESPIPAHAGQGVQVSLIVRVNQRWLGGGGGVLRI